MSEFDEYLPPIAIDWYGASSIAGHARVDDAALIHAQEKQDRWRAEDARQEDFESEARYE